MKMNNKAVGIIDAILVLTIVVLITTFFIFAFGLVLDSFLFEFQSLSIPMASEFSDAMGSMLTLAEMVYIVPIFMIFIVTVWLFKTIVQRHRYTREDEEEEW